MKIMGRFMCHKIIGAEMMFYHRYKKKTPTINGLLLSGYTACRLKIDHYPLNKAKNPHSFIAEQAISLTPAVSSLALY